MATMEVAAISQYKMVKREQTELMEELTPSKGAGYEQDHYNSRNSIDIKIKDKGLTTLVTPPFI